MTAAYVFADIGNSAIKVAWSVQPSPTKLWSRKLTWPSGHLALAGLPATPARWTAACVNNARLRALRRALRSERSADTLRTIKHADIPMKSAVDEPLKLGIDRLLAAWRAWTLNGETGPIVVVDAGTAVTVDLVDRQGVFQGGLIYPGLTTCRQALAHHTAALPDTSGDAVRRWKRTALGRNTEVAIGAGTLQLQIGGLLRAIEHVQGSLKRPATVFLSGGEMHSMRADLPSEYRHEPDLVLQAVAALAVPRANG